MFAQNVQTGVEPVRVSWFFHNKALQCPWATQFQSTPSCYGVNEVKLLPVLHQQCAFDATQRPSRLEALLYERPSLEAE